VSGSGGERLEFLVGRGDFGFVLGQILDGREQPTGIARMFIERHEL
jgi:hypothetical protein